MWRRFIERYLTKVVKGHLNKTYTDDYDDFIVDGDEGDDKDDDGNDGVYGVDDNWRCWWWLF